MADLFGEGKLKTKSGLVSASEALKGKKVVAVYFSAHWCPPCRGFTPKLKHLYEEIIEKQGQDSLAIIFVSSDQTEKEQHDYFNNDHGDWFAVPFGDAAASTLEEKCGVPGIPMLVIVNSKGEPIHKEARSDVDKGPSAAYEKWLNLK